ncbi:TetR/AcrR family transcriptional regulator [Microbacterium sp. EST19A]|uniref:TetR/AcrR family transcriptional regulator n=1 Tax=Microbacterium sp. EST19A TaxID=2862681 RepID=UPI001CBC3377|nr:TetR/AcrR family transcriptional regulator [Microbacterium sp. EST19A]
MSQTGYETKTGEVVGAQRQDAQRNREAVIAAARVLLARGGVDVSVAEIAQRAGVGKGTVFRHFASKELLVAEVVSEALEGLHARGRALLQNRDPAQALHDFMTDAIALQAADRAFCEIVAGAERNEARIRRAVERLHELVDQLTLRAVGAGVVRPDLTGRDVALLLSGIYQTAAPLASDEPELWRRYLVLVLDGLLPRTMTPLPN